METIRKFFNSLGLKSLQSVGLLQDKHIAIFITHEEDYTRLLMRATWYIAGAPMKVLKWTPDFYPNIESPVVLVWVGLPGLPLHFFEKSALFSIASVLGTPLKIDEPTARLSRPTVARICVEVDVSKPRNSRIWLGNDKEGFWQDVIFENPPLYCDFCQVLGHDNLSCFKKNPNLLKEPKKNSGLATTKVDRTSELPVKNLVKEKTKGSWRKKETDTPAERKNNEEVWTVVGGKKKNKTHGSPLTETAMAETVVAEEKRKEKSAIIMEVVAPQLRKNGPPRLNEEVAGEVMVVPASSSSRASENLHSVVAVNPVSDLARTKQSMGVGNERKSEAADLQGRKRSESSTKVQSQTSNSKPIGSNPSDPDRGNSSEVGRSEMGPAYLQSAVGEFQFGPSVQVVSKGRDFVRCTSQPRNDSKERQLASFPAVDVDKASSVSDSTADEDADFLQKDKDESKIQPLICLIDSPPSDESASCCGFSVLGCKVGLDKNTWMAKSVQNSGNLGFKGPNPKSFETAGPVPPELDQAAGTEVGKHQMGHSPAACPSLSSHKEMNVGLCQLNKMDSQPRAQSNSVSGNLSPQDADNSGSEASDYFDYYHSDGNFPDDSDWYSDDSESAKFLKGKWRRGYNLRATFSRRSLG